MQAGFHATSPAALARANAARFHTFDEEIELEVHLPIRVDGAAVYGLALFGADYDAGDASTGQGPEWSFCLLSAQDEDGQTVTLTDAQGEKLVDDHWAALTDAADEAFEQSARDDEDDRAYDVAFERGWVTL